MLQFVFFVWLSGARAECPDSSPKFMRMLGTATLIADGITHGNARTVDAVRDAIHGLDRAIRCSRLTLDDCGLQLLPERLQATPGPYRQFMREYVEWLVAYRELFRRIGAGEDVPGSELATIKNELRESVNRAHGALFSRR